MLFPPLLLIMSLSTLPLTSFTLSSRWKMKKPNKIAWSHCLTWTWPIIVSPKNAFCFWSGPKNPLLQHNTEQSPFPESQICMLPWTWPISTLVNSWPACTSSTQFYWTSYQSNPTFLRGLNLLIIGGFGPFAFWKRVLLAHITFYRCNYFPSFTGCLS